MLYQIFNFLFQLETTSIMLFNEIHYLKKKKNATWYETKFKKNICKKKGTKLITSNYGNVTILGILGT